MKKVIITLCSLVFVFSVSRAQELENYDTNDLKKLKVFLQQNAAAEHGGGVKNVTNAEVLLDEEAYNNYLCNDTWWLETLEREQIVIWNKKDDMGPKRIEKIFFSWISKGINNDKYYLSGDLDFSGCTFLNKILCTNERITTVNLAGCKSLGRVELNNNMIKSADFTDCDELQYIHININHLLPSNIKLTTLPKDKFDFREQVVTDSVYTVVWHDELKELCLKVDLSAELQFGIGIIWNENGIKPVNYKENTGIFYYKLADLQALEDVKSITLYLQPDVEPSDESNIIGNVIYTLNVGMGRIMLTTEPQIIGTKASFYLIQDDEPIFLETAVNNGNNINTGWLPAGTYLIDIIAPDYLFTYYSENEEVYATSWSQATKVTVSDGLVTEIIGYLKEAPSLTSDDITINGILEYPAAKSLLKASPRVLQRSTVLLHSSTSAVKSLNSNSDEWYLVATTQTDENGFYSFGNLPKGVYRISVEIAGFETEQIIVQANSTGNIYGNQNFVIDEENKMITANADPILSEYQHDVNTRWNVYPNPVADIIHINGLESAYVVKIINMSGQVVTSVTGTSPELTLHLNHLPSGMYLIRIELQGKAYTEKIMKN